MADLAPPQHYAHHRFGDVEELRRTVQACGWDVAEIRALTSLRSCDAEELWRWLWGSLPLRRVDGRFLSSDERQPIEEDVRRQFFAHAQLFRSGERYNIRSLAHMVTATASAPTSKSSNHAGRLTIGPDPLTHGDESP